jgi:uncharacterized protein YjbI with pentapeptide repeats
MRLPAVDPRATWSRLSLIVFLALAVFGLRAADGAVISSAEALDRLRSQGFLRDLTVSGALDLGALPSRTALAGAYRLERVRVEGPVTLHNRDLDADLRLTAVYLAAGLSLRDCTLTTLAVKDSEIAGPFEVAQCRTRRAAYIERSRFLGSTRFHLVEFERPPVFDNVRFDGPTEFLECAFATAELPGSRNRNTGFTDVQFEDSVLFNNSSFYSGARFQSVLFAHDASFLNVRMDAVAEFPGCHFKGDAEFRFCQMGDAHFGDRDNITLFAGRVDFRGCQLASAGFDFAEMRGEVSLVDARLGTGGASFRYANLAGPADFSALSSKGPLDLTRAYVPQLRFRWRELRQAILDAKPDVRTLSALHERATDLGDSQGKLDIDYLLKRARFLEEIAEPLPSIRAKPLEYIDDVGRRLIGYGEWVLWGWPTGYGNKLGRVTFLALVIWLIASLPMAWTPRLLARKGSADAAVKEIPIYDPLPPDEETDTRFAPSWRRRLHNALNFSFRLLFKVGDGGVRFVSEAPDSARSRAWRRYFMTLWYLGTGLLLLLTLTLANTSPVIERLIRGLFP